MARGADQGDALEIELTPEPATGEEAPEQAETPTETPAERALRDSVRELRRKEQTLQQRVVELNRADAARELRTQWTERLTRVTAAIAEAVTAEQVYQAVVDQTAAALGATTAGLWIFREAENVARLCRAGGYDERKAAQRRDADLAGSRAGADRRRDSNRRAGLDLDARGAAVPVPRSGRR